MILSKEDFLTYVETHKNRICIPVKTSTDDWYFIEVTESFISSLKEYANHIENIQFDNLYPNNPEGTIWLNTPEYQG